MQRDPIAFLSRLAREYGDVARFTFGPRQTRDRWRDGDVIDVHHDARWWPDPERFDPLRFTPEASASRPKFAYVRRAAFKRGCGDARSSQRRSRS
jgi:cytochrome P450